MMKKEHWSIRLTDEVGFFPAILLFTIVAFVAVTISFMIFYWLCFWFADLYGISTIGLGLYAGEWWAQVITVVWIAWIIYMCYDVSKD